MIDCVDCVDWVRSKKVTQKERLFIAYNRMTDEREANLWVILSASLLSR